MSSSSHQMNHPVHVWGFNIFSDNFLRKSITEGSMCYKAIPPREEGVAIVDVFSSSACFGMGLPIGLHNAAFRGLFALPLLLNVDHHKIYLHLIVDDIIFFVYVSNLPCNYWIYIVVISTLLYLPPMTKLRIVPTQIIHGSVQRLHDSCNYCISPRDNLM